MSAVLSAPTNSAFSLPQAESHYGQASSNVLAQGSRRTLMGVAIDRLLNLRAQPGFTVEAAMVTTTMRVLELLVDDGGPTPQLGANPSGAIEISWLVGDTLVEAIVEPNGDWTLWAETAAGEEVLDGEYGANEFPDPRTLRIARGLLATMGQQVRYRVTR